MPKPLVFLKAICPICNREYIYVEAFKPITCNRIDCVKEATSRGLI